MNAVEHPDPIPSGVRDQAARWLALRETGISVDDDLRFAAWLESSEVHVQAFAEAEHAFDTLDSAGAVKPCPSAYADPDLLLTDSEREQATTLPAAGSSRSRGWWKSFVPAAGLAAALAVGYVSWYRPAHGSYRKEASTPVGGMRELRLPDGSVILLNTATELAVDYSRTERRVLLSTGEALFRVAKNADRPFVVSANGVSVHALGTAFNVRVVEAEIEVLVTEGKVRVDSPARVAVVPAAGTSDTIAPRALFLDAGKRVSVPLAPGAAAPPSVEPVAAPDIQRALAWQEQRLEFYSTPLSDVVAQFNRYNARPLVVGDPALGQLRFGGKFRPDAPDDFVRLLEANFGVAAERRSDRTILRATR